MGEMSRDAFRRKIDAQREIVANPCAGCGGNIDGQPVRVESGDGYEVFLCCSAACAASLDQHDPHCTCNDCIADHAERVK